jgi:hypothetical protein
MSPTALLVTVLLVSTIAAILAGVAVFTNIAPEPPKDDPRIGYILERIKGFEEKIKFSQEEVQKDLLLMDRKIDKEIAEIKKEINEHLDRSVEIILKAIQDTMAD